MEYIKIDNDYSTVAEIERWGLRNFMEVGSDRYKVVHNLVKAGKVIDGYDKRLGYEVRPLSEVFGNGYHPENKLCYWLERPEDSYQSDMQKKMIVLFAPLPVPARVSAFRRMADNMWESLIKRIAPNTYILRIADNNLMSGSWYINTDNFPDYEESVQKLIKGMARDCGVLEENITLYGESRGAVGALLHGILGNYTVVSYDPILNLRLFHKVNPKVDLTLTFDMIPDNFIPYFNYLLSKCATTDNWKRKILTSSHIKTTFPAIQQLTQDKVDIKNINFFDRDDFDEGIYFPHNKFITSNYPLVLAYLNKFLYSCDMD